MVQRCEHCGQTVMATDQQCWHCGKTLSRSKSRVVKPPQSDTAVAQPVTMPSFSTILLYAGLTFIMLLILITTTHTLGEAPLFSLNSDNRPQVGWQAITDSQLQFTLNLPNRWHTVEMTRAPEADDLRSSPPLQALGNLFGVWAADIEFLFLGTDDTAVFSDGNPVFVLVTQSQRLQQVAPDELVLYLEQRMPGNITLSDVPPTFGVDDTTANSLLFNIEQNERMWRCHQQIRPSAGGLYLVFTCTSFIQFPAYLDEFETILRSFQPLES